MNVGVVCPKGTSIYVKPSGRGFILTLLEDIGE